MQQRHGQVHFHIRIDAAGQYALNLEQFLRSLPVAKSITVGEPKRNKDYRNAHFPKRKSDPVESMACARFAIVERPRGTAAITAEMHELREICGALESQSKHLRRLVNQFHNRLSRIFPELAVLATDLSSGWVLRLLSKYPTPERIAAARLSSLEAIPYVSKSKAEQVQAAAQTTTAALRGPVIEEVVRQLAREIEHTKQVEAKLKQALKQANQALPASNHQQLESIPGIGKQTAAALVAKVVSIDRFETPQALVSFFGVFPEENTSGTTQARDAYGVSSEAVPRYRGGLEDFQFFRSRGTAAGHPRTPACSRIRRKRRGGCYSLIQAFAESGNVSYRLRLILHSGEAVAAFPKPRRYSDVSGRAPQTYQCAHRVDGANPPSEPATKSGITGGLAALIWPTKWLPRPATPTAPQDTATDGTRASSPPPPMGPVVLKYPIIDLSLGSR